MALTHKQLRKILVARKLNPYTGKPLKDGEKNVVVRRAKGVSVSVSRSV